MPMLEVKNLTKCFGGLVAVNDLSFTLEETGIHALIGPNGSGKSTTINLITDVLHADSGSVCFEGTECIGKRPFKVAQIGIRRTWQDMPLVPTLTLLENIMVGAHEKTVAGMVRTVVDIRKYHQEEKILRKKAEDVLQRLGLYERRNEFLGSQPYGIRKLTAMGVALIGEPKLLLLDEPAAGLNPTERKEFIDVVLRTFDDGVKILIVEHNMDVVMSISKKITVLNFGSKIAEGSTQDIKTNDLVIKAYLGYKYSKEWGANCVKG